MPETSACVRGCIARDPRETHRAASPLELLFDLIFVIAISAAATGLAHQLAGHETWHGIVQYGFAFFGIWWAWMNYTWYASAFAGDDDVPFRLLTIVQMVGMLLFAVSISGYFGDRWLTLPEGSVIGYVVMRMAMVAHWLRAAAANPDLRRTCRTYAVGITITQIGWVVLALLPDTVLLPLGILVVAAELAVPMIAERIRTTPWHPGHIADRYTGLTIIVLGEALLGASATIAATVAEDGWSVTLAEISLASVAIVFALWWLSTLLPAADALAANTVRAPFVWGYGSYYQFATLAALGAGLHVVSERVAHPDEVSATFATLAMVIPIGLYVIALVGLYAVLVGRLVRGYVAQLALTLGGLVLATLAAVAGASLIVSLAIVLVVLWSLIAVDQIAYRHVRRAHIDELRGAR